MKWFCPYCWSEIEKNTTKCPKCAHDLTEIDKLSYEDKLILSLKNPIRENRTFAVYMLGQLYSQKAAKPLYEIALENTDTIELLYIAKALKMIKTQESLDYLKKLKEKDNAILKNFINKLEA